MMSVALLFAAFVGGTDIVEPTKEETDLVLKAIVGCYFDRASALDDGTSGADVIARAVVGGCNKELNAMDEISKRKIIAIANASPGLKQHEKNKLALTMLQDRPQEMRRDLESKAIEVVLRLRAKKRNAQD